MATLNVYHQIIEKVLKEYADVPYAYGNIKNANQELPTIVVSSRLRENIWRCFSSNSRMAQRWIGKLS